MAKLSYKDAGVNIAMGNAFVKDLKKLTKTTFDKNVIGNIGGFAGAYAIPSGFREPILLAATDGVGTKIKIAIENNRLNTIGIDLVAMCVNDLLCSFANPLFFLDYYATSKLNKSKALEVMEGIVEGCKEAECALIGGESAEMPGIYNGDDFDLAGFAVGIAERSDLEYKINDGDILIALPSSGIHSNGYSLVRKICMQEKLDSNYKIDGYNLLDLLLEPTRIYVKTFKELKPYIKALAHITGGGIIENLPRILDSNLGAKINKNAIREPLVFNFLRKYVDENDLYSTFNMGVGMVLVANKNNVDAILNNSDGYIVGEIAKGEAGVFLI